MIKDIKFLATTVQPNPKEITHWVDLNEDSTGGVIKTFDGKEWKSITSSNGDSDKYVNMTIELHRDNKLIIDGKAYNLVNAWILDKDLLNYLKNIYNSNKSLMIDYIDVSHSDQSGHAKVNTYVMCTRVKNGDIYYDTYNISLMSILKDTIIGVVDPDFADSRPG